MQRGLVWSPQQNELLDIELEGSKKGYEVIEKFLNKKPVFLAVYGFPRAMECCWIEQLLNPATIKFAKKAT